MLKSAPRVETYSYLNNVSPALLRPYLKEVMQKSTSTAGSVAQGTTTSSPLHTRTSRKK